MKGNFSTRVRNVIVYSREEAIRLKHGYVGTEHLLLGILRLGEGTAITILQGLGCDLHTLKTIIEGTVRSPEAPPFTTGNIPLTKQAEKVLKNTYREARRSKSGVIGTGHLLLSLLRTNKNIAAQVLQQGMGITYKAARAALDDLSSDGPQ